MRSRPLIKSGNRDLAAPALTDVLTSAATYARAEKAPATRRAYAGDWADFSAWCASAQMQALPALPATVAAYLAHLADAGRRPATIGRRLAAIGYAHRLRGHDSPAAAAPVRAVLRGIRRRLGVAVARKLPMTAKVIECIDAGLELDFLRGPARERNLRDLRDRALLLIGFAAALRRSELVALDVADLEPDVEGLLVHVKRSKTDQEGAGAAVPIPYGGKLRPVEALQAWLAAAKIGAGPVFRSIDKHGRIGGRLSDRAVADIVKRRAADAGFDPVMFSGHSLRAGFVTSALAHGADLFKVMDVTRHRRLETLKAYDRRAQAFRQHAGASFL